LCGGPGGHERSQPVPARPRLGRVGRNTRSAAELPPPIEASIAAVVTYHDFDSQLTWRKTEARIHASRRLDGSLTLPVRSAGGALHLFIGPSDRGSNTVCLST